MKTLITTQSSFTHYGRIIRTRNRNNILLLHFLEAASLLATAPGLGAIRYASPNGRNGVTELYILRKTGCAYVQCGDSPRGHHAAYTKMGPVGIKERQL